MVIKMKRTKIMALALMFILLIGLTGCSYFIPRTNNQIPEGTYSGEFYDYNEFNQLPIYIAQAYNLDDIEAYNDVLLTTKDNIIKATIAIRTTISTGLSEDIISGSGFVFKADDTHFYAVTNHHVIDTDGGGLGGFGSAEYEIKAYGDRTYSDAEVIVSSADLDLAVIKFPINDRDHIAMLNIEQRLGYRLKSDELVFAVGNPLRFYNNVSIGKYEGITLIENVDFIVIQHSAEIDEGSSGGALVDVNGNLLGINTWGLEEGNMSFAIPGFVLYNFLVSNNLIEN